MLTREEVVEIARLGRVEPASNFHARSAHGTTFGNLAHQLVFTHLVESDERRTHRQSFIARTCNWGGERYRIDFDVRADAAGRTILIVTGWKEETEHGG